MKIRVQMPTGVSSVSVAGQQYAPDEDGIVNLDSPEHVAPLVAAGGIELTEEGTPGRTSVLIGSPNLPATFDMGPGREALQLGAAVADAQARSGISVDEWNNLPQRARDILIGYQVGAASGAIGDVAGSRQRLEELEAEIVRLRGGADTDAGEQEQVIQDLRDTQERLVVALRQAGVDPAPVLTPEAGDDKKPDFASKTKAQINTWVVGSGGTEIPAGNHDAFVAAAEARWLELHPA